MNKRNIRKVIKSYARYLNDILKLAITLVKLLKELFQNW
jgi:hypothetical protein